MTILDNLAEKSESDNTLVDFSDVKDNILRDIPWLKTTQGPVTVEYAFKNWKHLMLEENVPAFHYGAQFRFLMTIVPLLFAEAGSTKIKEEHIDRVLDRLDSKAHLLDEHDPFLQLPKRLAVTPDALASGNAHVDKPVSKLLAAQPSIESMDFWNLENSINSEDGLDLAESTLLIVSAYFYTPGGNTSMDGRAPKNGASALRYTDAAKTPPAVEIIPLKNDLYGTLMQSTPKSLKGSMPHWADREGLSVKDLDSNSIGKEDSLWLFSWSSNTYFCVWEKSEEDTIKLKSVGQGMVPSAWLPRPYFVAGLKDQWKEVSGRRATQDPLYFYRNNKDGEKKLRYMNLGSNPFYYIARWNADRCSVDLHDKWMENLDYDESEVENILFLEHATGGTAQSFTIRHSLIVKGWKDEMLPDPSRIEELSGIYESILNVRGKLTGLFTENGTLKHLVPGGKSGVRNTVESYFWNEMATFVEDLSSNKTKRSEAKNFAKTAALKALASQLPKRDTINIEAQIRAEHIIRSIK